MFLTQGIKFFFQRGQLVLQNQYKMCSVLNKTKVQSAKNIPSKNATQKDINYASQNNQSQLNEQKESTNNQIDLVNKKSVTNEGKTMVYCHALPNDWDEKKLRQYFDPNDKNITQVKLLNNRIGGYTGRALIDFKNAKICDEYLKKYCDTFIDTTDVLQRIIMKPFELKTKTSRLQTEKTMKEVYLANLPYEVTSDEIYALGQDFGEVLYVDMPLSFDGQKNRGYCIVKFSKPEEASKFQKYFEEETLYGRKIRAQIYYYEFDTQKKRNERLSNKIIKEDHSIKNANIQANKELYKKLMGDSYNN